MCDNEIVKSAVAADDSRTTNLSKNTNKRRSLIFQRRSINSHVRDNIVDTYNDESEIKNVKLQLKRTFNDENYFDLSAYITSLKNERNEWRKVLNERKSKRRRLAEQESNIGNECELDLTVLTDSERCFISSRPNYHQTCKNIKNLVPLAVKIATLNNHINHLNKSMIESMKEKIMESTKQVTNLAKM